MDLELIQHKIIGDVEHSKNKTEDAHTSNDSGNFNTVSLSRVINDVKKSSFQTVST